MTQRFRLTLSALVLATAFAPAQAGTLTLDALSPAQRQQFDARLTSLARFESSARSCGRAMNVESRFRSAVGECLTPDTMSRVLVTFRQKLSQASGESGCDGEANARAMADRIVAEAAGMCRACLMTGMCK